ncbi:uncharacterized protein G2W53_025109 [Senna tora]|uniref:Uncharacterized protein n=1 Tax=Senna tora TaxID=362788 RepID=A0A834TE19_9FABA|nr:uncharacterized protein G2W53_025109 [Senna tora]
MADSGFVDAKQLGSVVLESLVMAQWHIA